MKMALVYDGALPEGTHRILDAWEAFREERYWAEDEYNTLLYKKRRLEVRLEATREEVRRARGELLKYARHCSSLYREGWWGPKSLAEDDERP